MQHTGSREEEIFWGGRSDQLYLITLEFNQSWA